MRAHRRRSIPRPRPGALALLRLHWNRKNRFPGATWSSAGVWIGVAAPFAVVVRYAGVPGGWPPVWLPLLDPLFHTACAAALLLWFCHREHLHTWHLGLDRRGVDGAAAWILSLLAAAVPGSAAALADPAWVERAPLLFAPAGALLRASEYEPGAATRLVAALSCLGRLGGVGPAQEIILTGLLYPTLRRRWRVLPAAAACAGMAALLDARIIECELEFCLWPTAQAAAAQCGVGFVSALTYEGFRSLWVPILWQSGFVLIRMSPGLPAALGF